MFIKGVRNIVHMLALLLISSSTMADEIPTSVDSDETPEHAVIEGPLKAPPKGDTPQESEDRSYATPSNVMPRTSWEGMKILHIGDSHLANWGFKGTLRKKFEAAGAHYWVSSWKGSSSHSWVGSGKLRRLILELGPDIVIVNLGTNVSRSKHPEAYAQWVKKVVKKIGNRECYWISPPPVIQDQNGLFEMLSNASGHCRLFDSRTVEIHNERKKNFHLSREKATLWAEEIWGWMNPVCAEPDHQPEEPAAATPEPVDGV